MAFKLCIILSAVAVALAQRPFYAGSGIGYSIPTTTMSTTTTTGNPNGLGDRFGEDTPTTTVRLPMEVQGDRQLYNYLSSLPIDKQPFWFINWQALEAHRQQPQTYDHKPPGFVDPNLFGLNFQQWA